jgi:excisionase family DNA binding protein
MKPNASIHAGLLTKAEAAQYLHIHSRTLDSWIRARRVPHYKMGRGKNASVRFKLFDLETMLTQYRVGGKK